MKKLLVICLILSLVASQATKENAGLCHKLNCAEQCPLGDVTCDKVFVKWTNCKKDGAINKCKEFFTKESALLADEVYTAELITLWNECKADTTCVDTATAGTFFNEYVLQCHESCIKTAEPPGPPGGKKWVTKKEFLDCRTNNCASKRKSCGENVKCNVNLALFDDAYSVEGADQIKQCNRALFHLNSEVVDNADYPYGHHTCLLTAKVVPDPADTLFDDYTNCLWTCEVKSDVPIDDGPSASDIKICQDLNCPQQCPILTADTCQKDFATYNTCYNKKDVDPMFCNKFEVAFQDKLSKKLNINTNIMNDWDQCVGTCGKPPVGKEAWDAFFNTYVLGCRNSCVKTQNPPKVDKIFLTLGEVKQCRLDVCKKEREDCQADNDCKLEIASQSKCLEESVQCVKAIQEYKLTSADSPYPYAIHACEKTCMPALGFGTQLFAKYIQCYDKCESDKTPTPIDPEDIDPKTIPVQKFTYGDVEQCNQRYVLLCPRKNTDSFNQKCVDELALVQKYYDDSTICKRCREEEKSLVKAAGGNLPSILYPKACSACYAQNPSSTVTLSKTGLEFFYQPLRDCALQSNIIGREEFYKTTVSEFKLCESHCPKCKTGDTACMEDEQKQSNCEKDNDAASLQCKFGISEADTAQDQTKPYPFSMMVCRASCRINGNVQFDAIQECAHGCNDAGKKTDFTWLQLKQCLLKYSPQGFLDTSKTRLEKIKLDQCIGILDKPEDNKCKSCEVGLADTETASKVVKERVTKECTACASLCISEIVGDSEHYTNYVKPAYEGCFAKGDYSNTAITIEATKGSSEICQTDECQKQNDDCTKVDVCKTDQTNFAKCQDNLQCKIAKDILSTDVLVDQKYPYVMEVCRANCVEANAMTKQFVDVQECRQKCNRMKYEEKDKVERQIFALSVVELCLKENLATPSKTLQPKTYANTQDLKKCIASGSYTVEGKDGLVTECGECQKVQEADKKKWPTEVQNLPIVCSKCAVECIKHLKLGTVTDTYTEYVALIYNDCYSIGGREKQGVAYPSIADAKFCEKIDCPFKCEDACKSEWEKFESCSSGKDDVDGYCILISEKTDIVSDTSKKWPFAREQCRETCVPEGASADFKKKYDCQRQCHTKEWTKKPIMKDFTFSQVNACLDTYVPNPRSSKDKNLWSAYRSCLANNTLAECARCRQIKPLTTQESDTTKYYGECQTCEKHCIKKDPFESDLISYLVEKCVENPNIDDTQIKGLLNHNATKEQANKCIQVCQECKTETCKTDQKEYNDVCRKQLQCTIAYGKLDQTEDNQIMPFPVHSCVESCKPLATAVPEWISRYSCMRSCGLYGVKNKETEIARRGFSFVEAENCIENFCFQPLSNRLDKYFLLWEQLELCKNGTEFDDCKMCRDYWRQDRTEGMVIKCEKCINDCNTKIKKGLEVEAIAKYDSLIGGCQSGCVESAKFNKKDTIEATKATYQKCFNYMKSQKKIVDNQEQSDFKSYSNCVQKSPQCINSKKVFDSIKDESNPFPYEKLNCHDGCIPNLPTKLLLESYKWERHCMTKNDNGIDDDIFNIFTLETYNFCKSLNVPECGKDDAKCQFFKREFDKCFTQEFATEISNIESCFYCNSFLGEKVLKSKFPKFCGNCTQQCLKGFEDETKSLTFRDFIAPALKDCANYGEIKTQSVEVFATKKSQLSCNKKLCGQEQNCHKAQDPTLCRSNFKDFVSCEDTRGQCILAEQELKGVEDNKPYPYSKIICFRTCLPLNFRDKFFDEAMNCQNFCMTGFFDDQTDPINPDKDKKDDDTKPDKDDKDDNLGSSYLTLALFTIISILVTVLM